MHAPTGRAGLDAPTSQEEIRHAGLQVFHVESMALMPRLDEATRSRTRNAFYGRARHKKISVHVAADLISCSDAGFRRGLYDKVKAALSFCMSHSGFHKPPSL